MARLVDQAGLFAINLLSRSAKRKCETQPYGSHPAHLLDWYHLDESAPTVLFFYGGNWQSGRRHDYAFVADTLMGAGCNVVVPDYRLYPHVRFDAIIEDAASATRFVIQQLPPDRPLYMMGHSAGAMMGALLSLHEGLLGAHREQLVGFVGLAGPYDFYPFTEAAHWELFRHRPKEMQPVNHARADAPEMYLLHGEDDNRVRRGHSKSLMEKQLAAGGVASREVYAGLGHADVIVQFARPFRRKSKVVQDVIGFVTRSNKELSA